MAVVSFFILCHNPRGGGLFSAAVNGLGDFVGCHSDAFVQGAELGGGQIRAGFVCHLPSVS
jgi:hypothetical protein